MEQLCIYLLPTHGHFQVRNLCAISGWSSGPVRSVVWWEWSCEKGLPAQGDLHSLCRSGEKGLGAAALLATYGTLFTVLYLAWPHPILHQVHCSFDFKSLRILSSAGYVWGTGVLHDLSSYDDTQRRIQQSQHEVS